MNARHALDLAVQVADALHHAHSHSVVHKDLRPDTIVETAKGSAKVLDFGMSAWSRGGQTRALAAAAPGSIGPESVLVLSYASPEQALGGHVDARTDVFSLGVVVYEMLTGANPFAGPDAGSTLINITQRVPEAPSAIVHELPKMVDLVLSRALSKDVGGRTESAAKFSGDLQRCLNIIEPRSSEQPSRTERPPAAAKHSELLSIDEDRGGLGVWWMVAALGGALAATVYYWLK